MEFVKFSTESPFIKPHRIVCSRLICNVCSENNDELRFIPCDSNYVGWDICENECCKQHIEKCKQAMEPLHRLMHSSSFGFDCDKAFDIPRSNGTYYIGSIDTNAQNVLIEDGEIYVHVIFYENNKKKLKTVSVNSLLEKNDMNMFPITKNMIKTMKEIIEHFVREYSFSDDYFKSHMNAFLKYS